MSLLNDLTLGQYLPIESPVHRLDPRTKLCGTLIIMAALMFAKDLWIYGPIYVWMSLVCYLSHLPFATVFKNIRAFSWLLAVTFFAHALFTPGMTLHFAGYHISWITHEGIQQGALFTARLTVIMTVAAILTLTTAPIEVADGLESLLKPFKRIGVPAHELAMMMVIALRFIPTLVEEADRLQKAQIARGANFSSNPILRARKLMALLIPLMLSAFRRADELALAMEARCYRGGAGRTQFRELFLTSRDYLALAMVFMMIILGWLTL